MGIGTSLGAFYRDEGHYAASMWDDRYDDNVIPPNKMQTDKQLDQVELDVLGIPVKDNNMPFPDNRNPDSTFDSRFGNLPPSGILNDLRRPNGTTVPLVRRINALADDPTNAGNFNTDIGEYGGQSQREFGMWMDFASSQLKRDVSKDFQNYDLQGYWKKYGNVDFSEGDHMTDEFKKPNHPTFSTESIYHGKNTAGEFEGGTWGKNDEGKDTFTPGRTNFEYYSIQEMQDYFKKYEPDAQLILPGT